MLADLHVHTTASDGEWSPARVVEEAVRLKLPALAITDHDTTNGLQEALEAGQRLDLKIIPGVELSTEWEGGEVHILGYFLTPGTPVLEAALQKLREGRQRRAARIVRRLQSLGYRISLSRVKELAQAGALGRPHIGKALMETGYVASMEEAFRKFLGLGAPGYVPREKISPLEAVHFLKKVGAVPVLAHPGLSRCDDLLPALAGAGLQGLEVSYPEHNPAEEERYRRLADKLGLAPSGGSDFHGPLGKRDGLGKWGVRSAELARLALLKPME